MRNEDGKLREDEPGVGVVDKRGQDDARSEAPAEDSDTPTEPPAEPPEPPEPTGTSGPPRVDFAALVISLASSAMVHLGLVPDPESGKPAPKNRELARHTIDTLEVLQKKTLGNLEPDEEKLLQGVLTELRMRFVESKD